MKNKKADVTITTVILVIAGIAVLAMLIFWLIGGGGQFGSWIGNLFGSETVVSVSAGCNAACLGEQVGGVHSYCTEKRNVKFKDSEGKLKTVNTLTCNELAEKAGLSVSDSKEEDVVLPTSFSEIKCSKITCPTVTPVDTDGADGADKVEVTKYEDILDASIACAVECNKIDATKWLPEKIREKCDLQVKYGVKDEQGEDLSDEQKSCQEIGVIRDAAGTVHPCKTKCVAA